MRQACLAGIVCDLYTARNNRRGAEATELRLSDEKSNVVACDGSRHAVLTYSRAKDAFAGLTLEGASIRQDNDSRHAIYGHNLTTRSLLLGKVPAPHVVEPFLAAIRGAKGQAAGKAEAKEKEKDQK